MTGDDMFETHVKDRERIAELEEALREIRKMTSIGRVNARIDQALKESKYEDRV